jgi:hypothetical protein
VTGDTKDGTVETIVAIEREQIRASFPLAEAGQRAGRCGEHDFVSDPAAATYRCPGDQPLRFLSHCQDIGRRIYTAPAGGGRPCDLRAQGTTAQRGRCLSRHGNEVDGDRVRGYQATAAYTKAMRQRQVWVEPLFAEAKTWHGVRRFRLRGLEKANSEAVLIAAGQNRKRLRRWRGWDRRPFPSGAAGVVLPALRLTETVPHDRGAHP